MESEVNLVLGFVEMLLALLVLLNLARLYRSFPWLAALGVFFILRGIDRVYVGALGNEPLIAPVITDTFLLAVVVLFLVGMRRSVLALHRSIDDADWQKREYERALVDYRRLVRHRLGNPLTVVLAGIQMLRRSSSERSDPEREIIEDIYQGVLRLEQVSVENEPLSAEEESLHPKPQFRR
jgi:signal transduction histidine kinase